MNGSLKKDSGAPFKPPRREFLSKSAKLFGGAVAASILGGNDLQAKDVKGNSREKVTFQTFDCHLHCPAEAGEKWQWHKVTPTFEDFVSYLDKTGVQQGIINSQRSFGVKPEEFIAGNREVARYVEKYKGRFLGACVVNPQYIEESLKEIEYCHNQLGFVWVGELCNYMVPYLYSISEFERLVEHVIKLNIDRKSVV
jgi:hypothetical protein